MLDKVIRPVEIHVMKDPCQVEILSWYEKKKQKITIQIKEMFNFR